MSNPIYIDQVEIKYIAENKAIPAIIIRDDYITVVEELSIPAQFTISGLITVFKLSENPEVKDLITFIKESKVGISINGNYCEWDEIKDKI